MTGNAELAEASLSNLSVRLQGGRLDILIDRAGKRNALSQPLLALLARTFAAHADDASIKVAVLRGAGDKSFAAGGDLTELAALRTEDEAAGMSRDSRAALDSIRRFPVPVVAALNGDALGGGAELAIACDMRVAAAHVRMGFVQGRLAITTAWGGGADLQDLVGPAKALALLCRADLMDAGEAAHVGLLDAVASGPDDFELTLGRFIAPILARPRQVLSAYKATRIARRLGADRAELERIETERFSQAWVHEDHWRAADGLLKRRGS